MRGPCTFKLTVFFIVGRCFYPRKREREFILAGGDFGARGRQVGRMRWEWEGYQQEADREDGLFHKTGAYFSIFL